MTDNSGGTANTTLESIPSTYSQSAIRNNFADLAAMVNNNTADVLAVKKLINQIIDDLQTMKILYHLNKKGKAWERMNASRFGDKRVN